LRIKLDENLPERLVAALGALGHDIDTVRAERLKGQPDPNVWSATQAAQRFFITQDLDFSDTRRYAPGTHAGPLLVRLTRPSRDALFQRVVAVFQTEIVESWTGCLAVVTDRKIRVRQPVQPPER
jgi:predicted nuclease of predicted toxin-antitoxin system